MMSRFSGGFHPRNVEHDNAGGLTALPELHHRENMLHQLQPVTAIDQPRSTAAVCLRLAGQELMVAIPRAYEPCYAYPLLVWLHGEGRTETELERIMPQMTDRNFFGIAFRGNCETRGPIPGGRTWETNDAEVARISSLIHGTVCQLRREYHIHSERIFVGGFGSGAEMALSVLLASPESYAGAVALGGSLPQGASIAGSFDTLRHTRVLLGTGTHSQKAPAADIQAAAHLLGCAGVSVTTRLWPAGHELTSAMLGHVNQWVMDSICTTVG